MILPRRLVLVCWLLAAGTLAAQSPAPTPAPVFADERAARVAERYKAMLAANPAEGLALDRLWKSYQDAGATGTLIEDYRRASEASPKTNAAPLLIYGHLLKKAGRLDEAAAAYDQAASADPTGALPVLAQAELALTRSRPADAAAKFETALTRLSPNDRRLPELLLKTGDAWQAAGQPPKAADFWEKTVALAPNDLDGRRRLAANYEKNHLPERAITHYEYIEAHADPAGRAAAARELGRLHEARGEFDAARDALERGLALTARDNWLYGDLQTRLIRLYQRADRVPELEARWQQAADAAPRDLGGYGRLEALAEAQGDTAAQRRWLEKIVALSPRDRDRALKLARLLADNGEREPAAALYDKLLQAQPGNLDLILARADLDVQGGKPDAAAARVEARLAQNPADESISTPALEFFLAHHLNDASEKLLRAQVARQPDATEPSLALAKFLFSQRQPDAAKAVLNTLAARPGDPPALASRGMAAADVYREQNLSDDALRCLRQAAKLQPAAPAPLLAASDVLLARGDAAGAAEPLRRAVDLTPAGSERVEVERKLFQVLQTASTPAVGDGDAFVGGIRLRLRPPNPAAPPTLDAATPLGRQLADLRTLAADEPTAEHSLRLARWQSWVGDNPDATLSAERAIELDPTNLPARELLVTLAIDARRRDAAESRLREIMALDPSRQPACLRQIAALEMQDNELDEALAIYDDLQKTAPGSVEALTDLATAQERADRWYDALATWEHAVALPGLTPTQRADVRRSLLVAFERLGQFPRAAEVLQAAVDAQTELPAREDTFRELSAFCHKHDLSDWLEKEYRARLAAQPNDYFTLTALAALSKDAGREHEAYEFLGRAFYSAPDPVGALRALVDAAGATGENEAAIAHQRRLTTLPGQATAENLEKLADLQSANLDTDAAARTWEQIISKFPRDPNSLERGADFFENAGKIGRARELFAQVIALDANNPRRLFHLARLDIDAGDPAAARGLLEQILAASDPEKPGDPLLPPPELDAAPSVLSGLISGMTSRRARTLGLFLPAAPVPAARPETEDERHLRLDAIRELSRLLLAGGTDAERRAWLDRWRAAADAGARSEPLTAYFYSEQKTSAMDLLASWVRSAPGVERIRNTFLAAGLRLGAYPVLAQWTWRDVDLTHRAERGQWLLGALQQYLGSGGKPGPGMVAGLFPADVKLRETLWEAASTAFADRHWYAQAAELGTRVYALVPGGRSDYALKIAQWELYVGNADHARAILRNAIESDRGETYEAGGGNSVFTALRAYVRLLPEEERVAFAIDYLQRERDRGELVHATLAAILLHGMAGDERAATAELDQLLGMRLLSTTMGGGTPDARHWNYILNNGAQLQAWGLDALAASYWRHALREVSAFERQDGDATNAQTEIRGRLLGVDVASANGPQQIRERVEDYLRSGPAWEAVTAEAGQLLAASQFAAAARLYEAVGRARPGDAENWRNLFAAYDSGGERDALERNLTLLLDAATPLPTGLSRYDLVSRLANLRRVEGDVPGVCRLLEHAALTLHDAPGLLPELARAEEQAGRWEQAARIWTQALPLDPGAATRQQLAAVEERLGHTDRAIALLKEIQRADNAAVQLARLYVAAHRPGDARALGTQLLQDSQFTAVPDVASVLIEAGERPFARELLAAAVRHAHDAQGRFRAQQVLVADLAVAGDELPAFAREMRRLETFTRADPASRTAFAMLRYRLARQRGADAWLEDELKGDWDGSKGDLGAGERLIQLYLETNNDNGLGEVVHAIDHHPDLPEQMLHNLEEQLVRTNHGALALPMLERLRRRFPQNDAYALDQARALWQAGRQPEARAALAAFEAASAFRDDLADDTAAAFLELGDRAAARRRYEAIARRDFPVVRLPHAAAMLARMDFEDGRLPQARGWLRRAYRNPAYGDFAPLVESLTRFAPADGEAGGRYAMPGGDVPLTIPKRAELLSQIYANLTAAGKPAEARGWVEAHPELLPAAPGLVARMRQVPGADLPALAKLAENAVSQIGLPAPWLERELAALYVQWAAQETAADPGGALNRLARAHELLPDDFDIAQTLASLCLAQKQDERAAAALAGFLGPDALPDERARAQQMLGIGDKG